ncbi:MAG: TolC family protein [bacterium]|nr:TolC family protein [bacterium]
MYTTLQAGLIGAALLIVIHSTFIGADTLTREDAVRLALERNPEVIAARKEWDAAQARTVQARALPDPELKLEFEELPGVFSTGAFGERNIGLTQRIEFPAKWWLRNRAAGQRADAIRMSAYEVTRLAVSARTKTTFDRVLAGRKILTYADENLKLTRDFLAKARVRFEAGDVSRLEVLRAEVEVGRAENQVTVAENVIFVARVELNALLAQDIQKETELVGDLDGRSGGLQLESLKKRALENRPDLKGAGLRLAGAQSVRSVAVSSIWPDLNLGIFRQTFAGPNGRTSFWRTSFGLEVPLWAMFRQRGEIAEAGAEVAKAASEEAAVRFQVHLDVEVAFRTVKAAEDQVDLFRDRVLPVAEQAYDIASRSYREGKASYLDLLEARRTLTESRIEYAEALFHYRVSLTRLEQAVGGSL